MKHTIFIITTFWALAVSCSVKENRGDCRGTYILNLTKVSVSDTLYINFLSSSGDAQTFAFAPGKLTEEIKVTLPQGETSVTAYCGDEGKCSFESYTIARGSDYPPLYASRKVVNIIAGEIRDTLSLYKKYSKVSVMLTYDDPINPYKLRILGCNDGYNSRLEPHEGQFQVEMASYSGAQRMFNLPQQTDGSLLLELSDPTSGLFRRFAIGQMILESGFDWSTPNLEDVILTLSYSTTELRLSISGWKDEYVFDINI